MQQITEIITNGAISILVILAGVVVRAVKDYWFKKVEKRPSKSLKSWPKTQLMPWSRLPQRLALKAMKSWSRLVLKSVLSLQNTILV
ncbi:phage holin, LL-H family [Streptococcus pneumoniae]|nr:phage holin, LL-H family [Streptococcus pneumoniae]